MLNHRWLDWFKSYTLKFLNLKIYLIEKCASVCLADVVGGTVAPIVDWDARCSVYVRVCGCVRGISLTRSIQNVVNANAQAVGRFVAALRRYSVHRNGSRSIIRKKSQRKSRMSRDLLLKILFPSLIIKRSFDIASI